MKCRRGPSSAPARRRGGGGGGAAAADDADDEAAAPFGARVAARDASLAVAAGGAAAVPAFGVDGGGGGKRRRPSAASQVAMLAQSLQNGDVQMLDEVLQVQDAQTVMNTVARLPVTAVLPFLEAILQRIQGKPSRVAALATWLRALLAQHAAYLMACPNLLELLTPLYQRIDERLQVRRAAPAPPAFPNARTHAARAPPTPQVFQPLLKLVGRMQMLQSQIAAQNASGALQQSPAGPSGIPGPMIDYDEEDEEDEEEELEEEGESGEEGEGESGEEGEGESDLDDLLGDTDDDDDE